jgi:hypothetical protein
MPPWTIEPVSEEEVREIALARAFLDRGEGIPHEEGERFANHRLVTGGRTAEGCDSSQVTDLPLVGQPIG